MDIVIKHDKCIMLTFNCLPFGHFLQLFNEIWHVFGCLHSTLLNSIVFHNLSLTILMDSVSKLNILCYVKCLDDVSPYVVLTVSVLLIVMLTIIFQSFIKRKTAPHDVSAY